LIANTDTVPALDRSITSAGCTVAEACRSSAGVVRASDGVRWAVEDCRTKDYTHNAFTTRASLGRSRAATVKDLNETSALVEESSAWIRCWAAGEGINAGSV
jgi:hypothetical protein